MRDHGLFLLESVRFVKRIDSEECSLRRCSCDLICWMGQALSAGLTLLSVQL